MAIAATYFDGKTSRLHPVIFSVQDGVASIRSTTEQELVRDDCPISELRVSERNYGTVRKVSFADGAYLEIHDHAAFNALLLNTGHQDSLVVRLQQSWRATLAALALIIVTLSAGYLYGLPAAAKLVASMIPVKVEHSVSSGIMKVYDQYLFSASELSAAKQQDLIQQLHRLQTPNGKFAEHTILFRKSKIGPNAFALPSGEIVVTDELINLVNDDQAILGVLAHELGHLHHRHLMRRLIQTSTVAAVTTLLFGDVSSVVANIPTVMADMKYSRDLETEADDYAIALLKYNDIPLSHLIHVFEEFQKTDHGQSSYFASHPASAERIARIKAAQ